jgi:hypothetical protein
VEKTYKQNLVAGVRKMGLQTYHRLAIMFGGKGGLAVDTFAKTADAVETLIRRLKPEELTALQKTIRERKHALKTGRDFLIDTD